MAKLWAGPYVGEFGWELFHWQGWLRKYCTTLAGTEILMACREGHEYLYQDFADKVITYQDVPGESDCEKNLGFVYDERHKQHVGPKDQVILPWKTSYFQPSLDQQRFAPLGEWDRDTPRFDVILHARNTNKYGTGYRDWSKEKWCSLVKSLSGEKLLVASMGTVEAALHVPGTTDIRGLPLRDLCSHLRMAKIAVGPSSGPLHLATLCQCPHIVWTGPHKNVERYQKLWNPFETTSRVVEPSPGSKFNDPAGWDADVEAILSYTLELVNAC